MQQVQEHPPSCGTAGSALESREKRGPRGWHPSELRRGPGVSGAAERIAECNPGMPRVTDAGTHKVVVLLSVIAVVLTGWALKATYYVTMPLAFAFFLALLVHPIQSALETRLPGQLHRLSLVLTMLVIIGVLALGLGAIWFSAQVVAAELPQYFERLQTQWTGLSNWARAHNVPIPQSAAELGGLGERLGGFFAGIVGSLWSMLAIIVLIFFLVLLMLLEASTWNRKLRAALPDGESETWRETVDVVARKVRRYLLVRTVVSVISGVATGLWLWLLGVDFAFFWGLLTFLLNYVPNIGSIVAVIPPSLLALLQFGVGWALLVIAGLAVMDQILGNFLDPRLQGRSLNVSPLVVLVSVIFWGWVWGIVGTLLAVPLTVTLIIICAHVPALKPLALLLSGSTSDRQLEAQTSQ